ncbi:MAG: hypothetical protein KY429_08875 [Actinobacteria bacterium]|nr:hypothetical protein [Actinomycetota bacterium]
MPKRTIAQAEQELGRLVMSSDEFGKLEREIQRAKDKAKTMIAEMQTQRFAELEEEIRVVKRAYNAIETEMQDLKAESERRDVAASEYRQRFNDLMQRREKVGARARTLDARIEEYRRIEADPEGWMDDLFERYPTIKPDFSF